MSIDEQIAKRQVFNFKIIENLTKAVRSFPNWRFGQILQNCGVTIPGTDCFFEESAMTYERMDAILNGNNNNEKCK